MTDCTIKNAQVVLPRTTVLADVQVKDGKINEIGSSLREYGEVIDAQGLHLIPGAIDPQVHFREPGNGHKENLHTGSCAAAAGGITSFLDMPNNNPSVTTAALMEEKKARAAKSCVVNYGFFIGATENNVEELNATPNVCGIKIFMGSSTGDLLVSDEKALENIFANGTRLIAIHGENEEGLQENKESASGIADARLHPLIRSEGIALKASRLAVNFSLQYNRRLHILHLTTEEETWMLRDLPTDHQISTEVCPQHFLLHAPDCYERLGTLAQMNPPVRTARHGKALWQALKDGIIHCIASDHAPHTLEEKDQPYGKAPSGMPGVETLLPVMLNRANQGLCTLQEVVYWMCEMPAKLYQMKGKGRIEVGADADLTLIDMKKKKVVKNGELFTKVNWSPYHGMEIQGWPIQTIVHGQTVFLEGEIQENIYGQEIIFEK